MILKEQAAIIMNKLNDIALALYDSGANPEYDIQFYITDDYQKYNKVTKLEDKEYIPAILTRLDPFVPKSSSGIVNDYLELNFYCKFEHKEVLEHIIEQYKIECHAISAVDGTEVYTQYIGNFVYNSEQLSQDGHNTHWFYGNLRIEWDTLLSGVSFDQTSITIDNIVYPVKLQTYRNDKSTIANKAYNSVDNINANLVSEELVLTIPLTATTGASALWQDIHTRSYNKTYTIIDNYNVGGIMTKTWELKAGIVNKEENKIVSFTCIFDIPLPRGTFNIVYSPKNDIAIEGTVIITSFGDSSSNSLDGRMKEQIVKAREVRQVNGYTLTFLYEPGNEMSKILAERAHKKIDGDRFTITHTFEDLTFTYSDLVIEKGSYSFTENAGILFNITFAEGI